MRLPPLRVLRRVRCATLLPQAERGCFHILKRELNVAMEKPYHCNKAHPLHYMTTNYIIPYIARLKKKKNHFFPSIEPTFSPSQYQH